MQLFAYIFRALIYDQLNYPGSLEAHTGDLVPNIQFRLVLYWKDKVTQYQLPYFISSVYISFI